MNPTSPTATVLDEVATWAGITTQPTPRGATAILFEGHELGHLHANRGTLDLPLTADRKCSKQDGPSERLIARGGGLGTARRSPAARGGRRCSRLLVFGCTRVYRNARATLASLRARSPGCSAAEQAAAEAPTRAWYALLTWARDPAWALKTPALQVSPLRDSNSRPP
jgi:Luciferase